MFDPNNVPDQQGETTESYTNKSIGEYRITDPVKQETDIKSEPLETVEDILKILSSVSVAAAN